MEVWVCTTQLRLKKTFVPVPGHTGFLAEGASTLQQLWELQVGCGEVRDRQWRDVPVVDNDEPDEVPVLPDEHE